MDLQKLNEEYINLMKEISRIKHYVKTLEERKESLEVGKAFAITKREQAKIKANTTKDDGQKAKYNAEKEKYDKLVQQADKEIAQIKENLKDQKESLLHLHREIDNKMHELLRNPEMKAHIKSILAKKYNREIARLENGGIIKGKDGKEQEFKGKKQLVEERDKLALLKNFAASDPNFKNELENVIKYGAEIKSLDQELESYVKARTESVIEYSDSKKAIEILTKKANLEKNFNKSKSEILKMSSFLMNVTKYKNVTIEEKDIDELSGKIEVKEKDGEIDLNATMDKGITKVNRQIRSREKAIRKYEIAKEANNLEQTQTTEPQEQTYTTELDSDKFTGTTQEEYYNEPIETSENTANKKGFFSRVKDAYNRYVKPVFSKENVEETNIEQESESIISSPEAYYRKRAEVEQILAEQKMAGEPTQDQEENNIEQKTTQSNENSFRDSLKYDIVKEMVNRLDEEILDDAHEKRKEETEKGEER